MTAVANVWDLIARDGASPVFNRVAVAADRSAVATERATKAGMGFGKKMAAAFAGFAVADVLVHATMAAANFQKSMLLIQTQAGASAKEVQRMSTAVLGLSGRVATGPMDLATSLYHVESAGLRGAKALNVTKIAAEGAKVGNADLEETTNALTSAVVSGIGGVKNMQQAMGVLNAIVGTGDMKLSDLNDALGTGLLASARVFGVSIQDVGAALAVFGDNNVRGADAATKLRMVMQDIAKPAANADEYLGKINLTAADLRAELTQHGLNAALQLLHQHLVDGGMAGKKMGAFLEDAFTKKAGVGLAILETQLNRFETKLPEITQKGQQFGADWAATTKTASFAFDKIKASVEAFGISLGTHLLPAVSSAANWLGKTLPGAFTTLVAVAKPVVQTLALAFIAAWKTIEPVVSATLSAVSGFFDFLKSHSTILEIVTGYVIALWAAVKGYEVLQLATLAVVGFANKLIMLRAEGAVTAGSLTKMFSPVNLALLGITAIVVGIVQEFQKSSAAAAAFAAQVSSDSDAIIATLDKQTAAITKGTQAYVEHQLASSQSYAVGQKYGLSLDTLTKAALDNKGALDLVNGVLRTRVNMMSASGQQDGKALIRIVQLAAGTDQARRSQLQLNAAQKAAKEVAGKEMLDAIYNGSFAARVTGDTLSHAAAQTKQTATKLVGTAKDYAQMAGLLVDSSGKTMAGAARIAKAVGDVSRVVGSAGPAVSDFVNAWKAFAQSSGTVADRASLIAATLKLANGDALSYQTAINGAASASRQFASDIHTAAQQVGKNGESNAAYIKSLVDLKTGTIDYHKAAAGPLLADLASMQTAAMAAAQAQFAHATATGHAKDAADQAYQVYKNQTSSSLIDEAKKLGLTTGQAQALAKQYFGMPKDVKTTIEAEGTDPILTALNAIGKLLAHITHQRWNTVVSVDTTVAMQRVNDLTNALTKIQQANGAGTLTGMAQTHAAGGAIHGPGTGTSDSILARVSDGEHVLTASDVEKAGGQGAIYRMRQAIQSGMLKFAKGGAVAPTAANYFRAFLQGIGAPATNSNLRALYGVSTLEGWNNRYNPLNVIQPEPGSTAYNSVGVQTYPDLATGVKGAVDLFKHNGVWSGVISALKDGSSIGGVLDAFKRVYAGWDPGVQFPIVSMSAGGTRVGPSGGSLGDLPSGGGITVGHVGGKKVFQYGGQNYSSLSAAQNAQSRASSSSASSRRSASLSTANSLISNVGQKSSPQFQVADVGITRVAKELAEAQKKIANLGDLRPSDRARFVAQLAKLVKLAQKQFDKLVLHIRTVDLAKFRDAIKGTAADVKAAFGPMLKDLKAAGDGAKAIGRLRDHETKLIAAVQDRNRLDARLVNIDNRMKALKSSVRGGVLGSFDVTSAGVNPVSGRVVGGSLLAQQTQAVNRVKRFVHLAKVLENRHLVKPYLNQLLAQGPSVLPQLEALATMGDKQFSAFNAGERQLETLAQRAGAGLSRHDLGATRERLRDQRQHAEHIAREQAHIIADEIRDQLKNLKINEHSLFVGFKKEERKHDRRHGVPGGKKP